ncbi:4-methylaminobutanoate oxidase (formaldehyde-forming) [Pseudoruegeria aquimaris]|uniref:4-methylaminobutanoate oxidase (Formaldehyde-forming) n=1 Tax=Pseudoruegeria aquimaris TaxID=393663 RepID=A0A1Y5SP73_9RHOB|nr:FAD-dependent oxidoreductase [Pseudoruegeria aquimaris]SLN45216.1 4-methylaminobutanoate oxidase (formaldehyde-forming) [Pseudoruegeria aquimaris]
MTDIIVIGGGIAGISAAARLSHLGTVTLLERESAFGYHASGRSAAMFEETYGLPSTIALNRASRAYHAEANGGVLSPRGLMLVAREGEEAAFEADRTKMEMEALSPEQAAEIFPILDLSVVTRAGYRADAWDIDTDLLMQNFLKELRANGGQALTGCAVASVAKTGAGWQVVTQDERTFTAPLLVNAAGAWADEIAALAGVAPLGLTAYRRSMARIPAPGGKDPRAWPMLFGPGESWYAKPDAGALLVSPAEEEPSAPMDTWADDMTLAEGLARYEAYVSEPVTRLLANWAGLRTFAPDRQLVIGEAIDAPGFYWCAGQGGYGFQSAPAYSALLADLVAGRTPDIGQQLAEALSPRRFGAA